VSAHLPPLPPLGGETTGPNVADVIAREHRELLALCEELTSDGTDAARRRRLAHVIVAAASRHLSAEEQYVYPAVADLVPEEPELVSRELAADRGVREALHLLDVAAEADLRACGAVVAAELTRHAESAAGELLPALLRTASVEDLHRLGNRFETAEEAAPTRPHPAAPVRPPWNKVVDPIVALADKLRDTIGRRTTYPRDL
jgi:hypothetical protein